MAETHIEWATTVWNPTSGCSPVSEGCANCYARRMAQRLRGRCGYPEDEPFRVTLHEDRLREPLRWRKPRRVFVASMGDLFHPEVPEEFLDRAFAVMALAQQHTFLVLTKRPERMRAYLTDPETPFRISKAYDALKVAEEVRRLKEELRAIPGYPGYFVSNLGVVYTSTGSATCLHCGKSVEGSAKKRYCSKQCKQNAEYCRRTGRPAPRFEPTLKPMSPDVGEQGHLRVQLHRDGGGRYGDRHLVHHLVLEAFGRPGKPGEQVCHLDGDPLNNALPNLRWGTQEDNWEDRRRHGKFRSHFKLTPEQANEIKERFAAGEAVADLARTFGVSATQIKNIVEGRQWATKPAIDWPLRNCWAGVTAENQARADERIPILLQIPAAVRWVSCEPLLGPIDLHDYLWNHNQGVAAGYPVAWAEKGGIGWIVCGSETGPGARPCRHEWAMWLRDQCQIAGVPFFWKRWADGSRLLDGEVWEQYPEVGA